AAACTSRFRRLSARVFDWPSTRSPSRATPTSRTAIARNASTSFVRTVPGTRPIARVSGLSSRAANAPKPLRLQRRRGGHAVHDQPLPVDLLDVLVRADERLDRA